MSEVSVTSMGILCMLVLWFYADLGARRLRHVFLAHAVTRIRPLLSLSYISLLSLLILSATKPYLIINIFCFAVASVTCLYFCYATSANSADFWAKRRNRALTIALISIISLVLINIDASFAFAAFIYGAIIFHRYRSKEISMLGTSMKDLAAVRQKLSSIDADRRNLKLVLSSSEQHRKQQVTQPELAG